MFHPSDPLLIDQYASITILEQAPLPVFSQINAPSAQPLSAVFVSINYAKLRKLKHVFVGPRLSK
jgi:hypothetical protein